MTGSPRVQDFPPPSPALQSIAERIETRSAETRRAYLERLNETRRTSPPRQRLSCGNLAHASAGCTSLDKLKVATGTAPNLGIVTAYNDILSAHQPYATYPDQLKAHAQALGATALVAGGVPAMCDGVTQGQSGMELSLFSREVIALATAVSLTHNVFDGVFLLGICDKIVPGLLIGALAFGHLPAIFVPAGPMPTGISNDEKNRVRQAYVKGDVSRDVLLDSEMKSYHSPGTCTFYGTANSNQMLLEIMGLMVPGAAFSNPGSAVRPLFTQEAVRSLLAAVRRKAPGIGEQMTARTIVNGIVGLHATGGSTNHLLHLVAIAHAAGYDLRWDDFAELSASVPLLARVYPNGSADVNQFAAAGGMPFVIRELLRAGLLFEDIQTIDGNGLSAYAREPRNDDGSLSYRDLPVTSPEETILRTMENPFQPTGGIVILQGNLGQAVVKASALPAERLTVSAPARIFHSQEAFMESFKAGEFTSDAVIVVRQQGPRANGMPELHSLMPALSVLQNMGLRVALVTDGRLSGASGKVLAALHVTPESVHGGPLSKLKDGDVITVDAVNGMLKAELSHAELHERASVLPVGGDNQDLGRNLFHVFRTAASSAERGASVFS